MAPARSPVLVGRGRELAAARRLLDAGQRKAGATLLVTGEAGIGKSRLIAEVAAGATADGFAVFTGRAVQSGGAYRAVSEALARPLRGSAVMDSVRLRPFSVALRRLVPGWAARPDALERADGPVVDPTVVLGEGVLALLQESNDGRGCVLVLEDLHWSDADTLALVTYLADAVTGTPLLLVLSARDDLAAPGITALAARQEVTVLTLDRLDQAGVAALAAACRGGEPVGEPELRALVSRSEGLPFLVEELLESGGPAGRLPPTLAMLVESRLATLPDTGRAVVEAAAVIGGDPEWRLLSTVTELVEPTVAQALRSAADVGLLVADDQQLRWRHALTRDAVLATLLPPERALLAARSAAALANRGEDRDLATAADLLVSAGERQRAAEILVELASHDADRGVLNSAADVLARAAATGRLAGTVAAEQVRVLTLLGRVTEAVEAGSAALAAGAVVGDDHAELCIRLARACVNGGRWTAAEGYLERAGRPEDPRSLVLSADAAFGAGQVDRAAGLARAAVEAAERDRRTEVLCEALMVAARCAIGTDLEIAASGFARAAQVAAEDALTPWRVQALFGLGSVELTAGNPATPSLAEAGELAVEVGMLAQAAQADLLRADAVLLVDGPRAAMPIAQLSAERAGRLRHSSYQAMAELVAAAAAGLAGELAVMTALLDAAASRADRTAEVETLAPVVRGLPHLVGHDLPRAAALFDQGIPALMPHGSAAPTSYFGLWALLRTAVADRDEQARESLRAHHTIHALTNRAALTYADAIAAGRAGRSKQAAQQYAEADVAMSGLPWWNRLLRLLALEAAVRDGWGDPVPALRADLAVHETAGDPGLARTCRGLLRAAGAPTRRGRGHSPVPPLLRSRGITSRELDVLTLAAQGLANSQIAERLFLSPRTVESHIASLLAKTGATSRVELRAWADSTVGGPLTP